MTIREEERELIATVRCVVYHCDACEREIVTRDDRASSLTAPDLFKGWVGFAWGRWSEASTFCSWSCVSKFANAKMLEAQLESVDVA
jgi:hypothetical protein